MTHESYGLTGPIAGVLYRTPIRDKSGPLNTQTIESVFPARERSEMEIPIRESEA
jgi:hypothetical protein